MPSKSEYNHKYYLKNRKRVLARNKKWNAAHRDVMQSIEENWKINNPQANLVRYRKYQTENREACRARCRDYQKRHPEVFKAKNQKRRTAKTLAGGCFTPAEWTVLCEKHHSRCLCCGKKRKLTADHVVPVSKGGSSSISNIQPLCGPCNSSKGTKTTDFR